MTENLLYIVIPVHNRLHFTRDCLTSLQHQTIKDFRIIVVDDGSTDGTNEMIINEFPETILLPGDGNLWWTRATNLGVEYAITHGATHVMTLNDDTVASDNFIERMLYWSEMNPRALLGAFAIDLETKIPVYGGERGDWKKGVKLLDILTSKEQHGLHAVTHFPGRGLLVPIIVYKEIGIYDQVHFPQCTADEDFTFRAARAGYKIYCNYDSILFSRSQESSAEKLKKNFSLKNYWQYLFGKRSNANLKYYILHVFRNCPPKRIPFALVKGITYRIFGYLKEWVLSFNIAGKTYSEGSK